jgi:hypothetical protein
MGFWLVRIAVGYDGPAGIENAGGLSPATMYGRMIPGLRSTFSSLHHRNFRLFFVGQSISNSGNWLTNVALTLLVLKLTATGVGVGLVAACQFGPMLLLSAWGGAVADRASPLTPCRTSPFSPAWS